MATAVKAGNEVDLSPCPERERTLRASVLREILLSHVGDEQSPGGIQLRGAVIDGDLDLRDVPEAMMVDLTDCQVTRIRLHGANPPPIAGKSDPKRPGWLRVASRWSDRIGTWQSITVLAFGFVVVKVIWIARGDIPTALGVFDSYSDSRRAPIGARIDRSNRARVGCIRYYQEPAFARSRPFAASWSARSSPACP